MANGFPSYDSIINAITTLGQADDYVGNKVSGATTAAGIWHSLWYDSGFPGAGSDPATTPGTAYNGATAGAINFGNVSPMERFLLTLGAISTQSGSLMLYDRLVGVGGISLVGTGDKTVSSVALPRYTSGAGVQAWLEVTTQTATSIPVVSMDSYTNQAGVAGRGGATVSFPSATTKVRDMVQLPIQAGDSGIQAVSTINVGTAPSAGVVNLLLIKPLAFIPLIADTWNERDFVLQLAALPRLYDGMNLALAFQNTVTTAPTINFQMRDAYN